MDLSHAAPWVDSIFHLKVPVLEKFLRSTLVYLALIGLLRVFGKRELAQLNSLDLVVLLSLSNTVQNAIIGEDNSFTGGVIGAFSLLAMNYLVARLMFRYKRVEEILTGSPARLITNGQVDRIAAKREGLSESELLTAIHRQGFDEFADIATCTLEAGGGFSIKGRKPDAADLAQAQLLGEIGKLSAAIAELRQEVRTASPNRVN